MKIAHNQLLGFLIDDTTNPMTSPHFNRDVSFAYSAYVMSQMQHSYLVTFHKRSISDYISAHRFLKGETEFLPETLKVLGYFYKDLTTTLVRAVRENPTPSFKVSVEVDISSNLLSRKTVRLDEICNELQQILDGTADLTKTTSQSILVQFKYKELGNIEPSPLLALASVLNSNKDFPQVLEVR